ncbi:MAG TPA: DEDD exonuclease domain-containing protein [Ornithinimicrobium sp.]|uniref:DEDD exonuclease domain-containing protein n=1 Tax=Ornithinimicrobium sp. TaxID=1977084 RepID=UPI002B46017A|nr:DEDD exonuclease domain-containing protein [Ornithinimicrobium sp.]HKJ12095.1 DEDD exonuclease domain-containing protein [Ornithinimicrobium sp.]
MLQPTFDDLGTSLDDVTFVVVDLETTGGSASECQITEIGAVKVRGGAVLAEFQSLVRPTVPIPGFITVLTGISSSMVASAPPIETALPAFLEFARGSVLVAHNAAFDVSFLKVAAGRSGYPWPAFVVIDTVALARQLVGGGEAPNHRLATLARLFGAHTAPDHRALHDARATVDVLHALIARIGNQGVRTIEELVSYSSRVPSATRRKRFLADTMPEAPGVYVFKDHAGRALYVGTSVNIRRRTRSYFTASETRRRMRDMVRLAESITPVVCQTRLEAQVRELRLIAEHKPAYNKRSRHPERAVWVKLTREAFPRLSIVRAARSDGADYVGPFARRDEAQLAIAAVHEVVPIRQCTSRLSKRGDSVPCILEQLGRCGAPCAGRQSITEYAAVADQARSALVGNGEQVVLRLRARMEGLAAAQRYEEAATTRDRAAALMTGAARTQRLRPVCASPEIVAARRHPEGGWEVVCVRYGRLAGVCRTTPGRDPMPQIEALRRSAEAVPDPGAVGGAALPQESELILDWLETPGTRLVDVEGQWTCPVGGAASRTDSPLLGAPPVSREELTTTSG